MSSIVASKKRGPRPASSEVERREGRLLGRDRPRVGGQVTASLPDRLDDPRLGDPTEIALHRWRSPRRFRVELHRLRQHAGMRERLRSAAVGSWIALTLNPTQWANSCARSVFSMAESRSHNAPARAAVGPAKTGADRRCAGPTACRSARAPAR